LKLCTVVDAAWGMHTKVQREEKKSSASNSSSRAEVKLGPYGRW